MAGSTKRRIAAAPLNLAEQAVVEFLIDRCLLTRTRGHGDVAPRHTIWRFDPPRTSATRLWQ